MSMKLQESKKRVSRRVILCVVCGLLLSLSAAAISVSIWCSNTFPLGFKTLLNVLAGPLQGTASSTVNEVIKVTVIPAIITGVIYTVAVVLLNRYFGRDKEGQRKLFFRIGTVMCCVSPLFALIIGASSLGFFEYFGQSFGETRIYEDYYIDPNEVEIKSNGNTKNLVYIYVESLESTYASVADGGRQAKNYMPLLTALAADNVSFTEKEDGKLGGFISPQGTGWTIAALLATSSGIPFSFPLGENGNNAMSREEYFASGLTTLGDILEEKGYRQMFLCGSDIGFAGRDKYYEQHGNYEIYDLATAREEGVVAKDYHNGFWGIEDIILFDIAKKELTELAAGDEPFNFTMLTVDLHHNGGYLCAECGNDYAELNNEKYQQTANVITCNDKQIAEFVEWCKEQDWYEDTVIVISGDHPRMDVRLVNKVPFTERTVYNCFINAAVEVEDGPFGGETGRVWTSFDMFPTTLAAMGFEIEGDRLGLGTNMFSGLPTLAEKLGFEDFEAEIMKQSDYYVKKFSPELWGRDN